MESKVVEIVSSDGRRTPGEFRLWEESPEDTDKVLLELRFGDRVLTVNRESGFFDALCAVRKTLELEGLRPLCFGASKDVYPSPMIRSMGSGERAYRLTLGRPARTEDLVSVFDADLSVVPVSVEEQEAFYRKWLESLK